MMLAIACPHIDQGGWGPWVDGVPNPNWDWQMCQNLIL